MTDCESFKFLPLPYPLPPSSPPTNFFFFAHTCTLLHFQLLLSPPPGPDAALPLVASVRRTDIHLQGHAPTRILAPPGPGSGASKHSLSNIIIPLVISRSTSIRHTINLELHLHQRRHSAIHHSDLFGGCICLISDKPLDLNSPSLDQPGQLPPRKPILLRLPPFFNTQLHRVFDSNFAAPIAHYGLHRSDSALLAPTSQL